MSGEAFGAQVFERRQQLRMSRAELTRLSGISEAGIRNLEAGIPDGKSRRWPEPKRETIVDLAAALAWEPDEALQMMGHQPLSEAERARVTAVEVEPRYLLDRLWGQLTGPQRQALVRVAAAMVDPQGGAPAVGPDVVVFRFAAASEGSLPTHR